MIERFLACLAWFLFSVAMIVVAYEVSESDGDVKGCARGVKEVREQVAQHGHGYFELDKQTGRVVFVWDSRRPTKE